MPSIFEDEGRKLGDFSSRPCGFLPKSALATSQSLASEPHFPRSHSSRQQIFLQTVTRADLVRAA